MVFIDPTSDGSSMVRYPKSMQSGDSISINDNVTAAIAIISSAISCLNRCERVVDRITPKNSDPDKLVLCKFIGGSLSITGFTPKRKFRHATTVSEIGKRSSGERHFTCTLRTFSEYVASIS